MGWGNHPFDSGPDLNEQLRMAAVSAFRETELGRELEAEYVKQGIISTVDDPILWLGVGLFIGVVIYVLIK
jgi:hypothetical protein